MDLLPRLPLRLRDGAGADARPLARPAAVRVGQSFRGHLIDSTTFAATEYKLSGLGLNDPEGPYIYVEGVYRGHEVFLQELAHAPEDEEPGLKFDATGRPRRLG
jgi:hypothetical protein